MLTLGGIEIFEVKLNDEFLMSSLFHDVEEALADLALAQLLFDEIDVVVGGLGLGYTAVAALRNERVRSLIVVDLLAPVIEWHQKELIPLGSTLNADSRCRLQQGDFFAGAVSDEGWDPESPGRRFHAILLDIDHSPARLLAPQNESFYSEESLRKMSKHLLPGGVFALWSDDGPEEIFITHLANVFDDVQAHVIYFDNPILHSKSTGTVYHCRPKVS